MASIHDIQGVAPADVVEVWNQTEMARQIDRCVLSGQKIVDYGTIYQGLGYAPPQGFLRLISPSGVLEHHQQDMTVKVRAATTLHDLARTLAERGQWLPIDGADDSLSIGEVVAHNHYGPLRLGFGAARDLLLGMTLLDWNTNEIRVGGRTMKNVAGYDMTRFMVGHMNMMGIVTDLTLRTWAIPPQVTRLTLPGVRMDQLDGHLTELLVSDAAPIYLDHQHTADQGEVLYLGYAGSDRQCAAQFHALRSWLPRIGYNPREASADREDGSIWEDARARALRRAWRHSVNSWVKLIAPPGHVGAMVSQLIGMTLPANAIIESLPGHGIVHLGGTWSIAQARELDPLLLEMIGRLGGLRLWMRRPDHTLRVEPVSPVPQDWQMVKRLIDAMDPRNIFNPGRLAPSQEP